MSILITSHVDSNHNHINLNLQSCHFGPTPKYQIPGAQLSPHLHDYRSVRTRNNSNVPYVYETSTQTLLGNTVSSHTRYEPANKKHPI